MNVSFQFGTAGLYSKFGRGVLADSIIDRIVLKLHERRILSNKPMKSR